MSFNLSKRSRLNLENIHPDLLGVVMAAGELCSEKGLDFIVTDGHRTVEEQREFVRTGKSKTMKSRHLGGFAIDYVALVSGRVTYDVEVMTEIAECFKRAASSCNVPIVWGGDWVSFKDTPHIQLCASRYPDA
jgi:peptidoglycan L-alanyl-D-glutamate endopeptidase CwlK